MPPGMSAWRVLRAASAYRSRFSLALSSGIDSETEERKSSIAFLRCFGLVGQKQVTGVIEEDEFCAWNPFCDQLSIAGWHQRIRFPMDDERRRLDLSDPAIAFPIMTACSCAM
jgi:hypothetical protein